MRNKLLAAATQAANEAMLQERGRALWCLDQVMLELRGKLQNKLVPLAQEHALMVKIKIADAVCKELRRAIVSGAQPVSEVTGLTGQVGTADFSPLPPASGGEQPGETPLPKESP